MAMSPNIVSPVQFLIILGFSGFNGLKAAANEPKAPIPVDLLVILDAETEEGYRTGISAIQDFDAIPGSSLTVVSNDQEKPLLKNVVLKHSKAQWKAALGERHFSPKSVKRFNLYSLWTLTNGHFNNHDHPKGAEIAVILSEHKFTEGDLSLVSEIRKKKIFAGALLFPKVEFSEVFKALAADDEHVMAIENPLDVKGFIRQFRILISKDSHYICDTDRYNAGSFSGCYSHCSEFCLSTQLLEIIFCKGKCPFFKKDSELENLQIKTTSDDKKKRSKGLTPAAIVGICAGGIVFLLIVLSVVLYCVSDRFQKVVKEAACRLNQRLCRNEADQNGQGPPDSAAWPLNPQGPNPRDPEEPNPPNPAQEPIPLQVGIGIQESGVFSCPELPGTESGRCDPATDPILPNADFDGNADFGGRDIRQNTAVKGIVNQNRRHSWSFFARFLQKQAFVHDGPMNKIRSQPQTSF